MPMDRHKLSARLRQPGHDQTFIESEQNFLAVAQSILGNHFLIESKPKDLLGIFSGIDESGKKFRFGLRPEAKIQSRRTNRMFFVEVKKQGLRGNAEERAMKHHTVKFYEVMKKKFKYRYHPFVTIFCDDLAKQTKYTAKFKYFLKPNQYLLWKDYDRGILRDFLIKRCAEWLEDDTSWIESLR